MIERPSGPIAFGDKLLQLRLVVYILMIGPLAVAPFVRSSDPRPILWSNVSFPPNSLVIRSNPDTRHRKGKSARRPLRPPAPRRGWYPGCFHATKENASAS